MEELKDQFPTIDRVRIWRPNDITYTRARVLVVVYSIEETSKAYKDRIF